MRVALVSYECADYSIQLANGLARECDVLLMLSRIEAAGQQALITPSIHFQPFDKPRLRQAFRQIRTSMELVRRIRRFRPDVLHVQHGHLWFNLALPLLRSIPLVITVHDPHHHVGDRASLRTPNWIIKSGSLRANRLIVHGETLKRQLAESLGSTGHNIHVVPHIAIGAPDAPALPDDGSNTILFFGRIWDYKGLKHLIEAEPLIRRDVPDARIVIAGEGADFAPYRQLMERPDRFEVHNRFITTGHRDELFRRASVVALPYIEATQSGVIPVAYSFAKPVVATRVGALAEAVDDGVTGLLVPPADSQSLATALIELLQNPKRRRAMGAAGREKLDTEWSPDIVAQRTMEIYRRAIRDRKHTSGTFAIEEPRALEVHESRA
jgi:glycosyltransferase involved in cell wall biosynthesis